MALRRTELDELLRIVRTESNYALQPVQVENGRGVAEGIWFHNWARPEQDILVRDLEHWRQLRAELYEREEAVR